jgi:hypothetical protein
VCGLAISQFGATGTNAPLLSLGSYAVLIISLTITSICSVYNDKVLKDHADVASLHTVNALLYAVGALLNGLVYLFSSSSTMARPSFFSGFERPFTWIVLFFNTVIGIVVSAVYKYADATIKTFASACATSVLLLINIIANNQEFKIVVVLACITVFIATYLYATNSVKTCTIADAKSVVAGSVHMNFSLNDQNANLTYETRTHYKNDSLWNMNIQFPWFLLGLFCACTFFFLVRGGCE